MVEDALNFSNNFNGSTEFCKHKRRSPLKYEKYEREIKWWTFLMRNLVVYEST